MAFACGFLTVMGFPFDAIVIDQHLLEIMSNEFITSVKCDLGRPGIPREPFLLNYIGHSDGSFVIILVYLKPT